MRTVIARLAARYLDAAREFRLSWYGLEGLDEGKPVTLYHGTTRSFKSFDLSKSREDLVNDFYGTGIFLTPSKRVAWKYAYANRNIGFDPSIISALKRRNPNAGAFLEALYEHGDDAWEMMYEKWDLPLGAGLTDALDKKLGGVDGNTLGDIAAYILGSKVKPLGSTSTNIFDTSTGAPSYIYDALDEVGLDSSEYRPKVYTVSVQVKSVLITASQAQARKARAKGYDAVVYHGRDLVDQVPEVAVYNPRSVKIKKVEVG